MESSVKKLPLHDTHHALGAKMLPFAGYEMPIRYTSDIDEHMCVRLNVGIFDVSHMGEFIISGNQALEFLQLFTTNDVSLLPIGKIQYSCFTNENGGVIDDLLVYRMAENEYMLVVNASNIEKNLQWLQANNAFGASIANVSDNTCLFALQGPKAIECLQKICNINLSTLAYYSFVRGKVGEINNVLISHTGYTGAGGFELYISNQTAEKLWHTLMEAGREYNIKPIGLGARDTLRLEMGYCLYGNELNEAITPLEAGLGWITKFSKKFIGSNALLAQKNSGVSRKLIGFTMLEKGIPRRGYEIYNSNYQKIGEVTSGTQSPVLNTGIGLGYVSSSYSIQQHELYIKIRDQFVKAKATQTPFVRSAYK